MRWRRTIGIAACLTGAAAAIYLSTRARPPRTREDRAADALGRVSRIEPQLAKLRHLALAHEIPAEYQRTDQFRAFVRRSVARTTDPDATRQAEILTALGLLPPQSAGSATTLERSIEDAQVTQAAAYYDPAAKKFFLVMVPQNDAMLDMICAHELTHGLQDQNFDLTRYLTANVNSDALAARRFVVEGDATLSMAAYEIYETTQLGELTPEQLALLREKIETFASLDSASMTAALKQQARVTPNMDPEIARSLDAMDSIPRTILEPLLQSYMKGALVALTAYERGGWGAVDDLFRDPPESTEQVLHPRERLIPRRDHPHRVTLPRLDGYDVVGSDVIGELQWSVYFSLWKHTGEGREEQNWAGDRYAVLHRKDGKRVVLIATIWDTAYDAKVFYDAYMSTMKTRFPKGGPGKHGDKSGDAIWVKRSGERVFIVNGDNHDLLERLADETTFE
ncbi:MAG TPA: hypothetical protein VIV58_39370 [Kofleriaceae bacterium]